MSKKYIRADLFMNFINRIAKRDLLTTDDIETALEMIPAEDVKPVKYTSWHVDEDLYTSGECQCLRCGAIFNDDMIDSAYCPNCGAMVIDPEEECERAVDGKDD